MGRAGRHGLGVDLRHDRDQGIPVARQGRSWILRGPRGLAEAGIRRTMGNVGAPIGQRVKLTRSGATEIALKLGSFRKKAADSGDYPRIDGLCLRCGNELGVPKSCCGTALGYRGGTVPIPWCPVGSRGAAWGEGPAGNIVWCCQIFSSKLAPLFPSGSPQSTSPLTNLNFSGAPSGSLLAAARILFLAIFLALLVSLTSFRPGTLQAGALTITPTQLPSDTPATYSAYSRSSYPGASGRFRHTGSAQSRTKTQGSRVPHRPDW